MKIQGNEISEEKLNKETEECPNCEGQKTFVWSCCGDDITHNDIDLCPTCGEHCGDEEEDCEVCNGLGFIITIK